MGDQFMKVYLDTIGCRLNQSEIEKMAGEFRAAGHTVIDTPAGADLVVVNTCTVTAAAASDSRQKIRQAGRAGGREIVVTGCWATLDPAGAGKLPNVTRVVSNVDKDSLVADALDLPEETFDREPLAREPLPGIHLRTRAFLKVQDGCDNHCTFCITRVARGASRSRSLDDVLADVRAALQGGTQEIVLTGVQLGAWGADFEQPLHLRSLIEAILKETDAPRLRLSSLEPWNLDDDFFSLWQDERLCRHLHLPLQSGCADTLRKMARKTTPDAYARLVESARAAAPDIAITTDLIAGFPGETDEHFAASLAFVRKVGFAAGHVFTYSARPGTPAARYKDQVPFAARKQRNAELRAAVAASSGRYQQQFQGQTLDVLWESTDSVGQDGWRLQGLTGNYLRVSAHSPQRLWNQISRVRLTHWTPDGFQGEIVEGDLTTKE